MKVLIGDVMRSRIIFWVYSVYVRSSKIGVLEAMTHSDELRVKKYLCRVVESRRGDKGMIYEGSIY